MQPRYEPHGVEERWQETWEAEGLYNADPDPSRTVVRDRASAAQRDRRAAPRATRCSSSLGRRDRPHAPDAGLQRALPAGLRPRRHLDAERRREAPRARGQDAPRPRPRGVRGARLGVAARVRRQDHAAVPAHRRIARLPARAVHDGRRVRPRGDALLRAPVGEGLDLPREPDRQLVPVPPDLALRPRARARGRRRRAHVRPLPVRRRRRSHHDRHGAAGDDPRRRRGRRASRRRALPRRDRPRGRRARGSSGACR